MYNQKKFSVNDIYQNSFYQVPSFFFLEDFPKISDKAIILYSLLKSRHELSMRNKWFDKEGDVYLIMKREEMEKTLRCSRKTIIKAVEELKKYNLLIEIRQGKGLSNLIYITYPDIDQIIKESNEKNLIDFNDFEIVTNDNDEDQIYDDELTNKNDIEKSNDSLYKKDKLDINYWNKKQHVSVGNAMKCKSYTSLEDVGNTMKCNISTSRCVNVTPLNRYIDNNINNKYNNLSFIQKEEGLEHEGTKERKIVKSKLEKEIISDDSRKACEESVKENTDFELLIEKNEPEIVNEIIQIIVDILCSSKNEFRINGCDTSSNLVKTRFKKLDQFHIEFVIDCLSRNTTEVRDIRAYLMTTLYNAPMSMNLYYKSKINHDLSK